MKFYFEGYGLLKGCVKKGVEYVTVLRPWAYHRLKKVIPSLSAVEQVCEVATVKIKSTLLDCWASQQEGQQDTLKITAGQQLIQANQNR